MKSSSPAKPTGRSHFCAPDLAEKAASVGGFCVMAGASLNAATEENAGLRGHREFCFKLRRGQAKAYPTSQIKELTSVVGNASAIQRSFTQSSKRVPNLDR